MVGTKGPCQAVAEALVALPSLAHRARVFFTRLWSGSIKAALSLQPLPPFYFSLQSKIGARACRVARPSPGRSLWPGVDYQRQEERDTDLWSAVGKKNINNKKKTASCMQERDLQHKGGEYTVQQGGGWGSILGYTLSMPSIDVGHLFSCICS